MRWQWHGGWLWWAVWFIGWAAWADEPIAVAGTGGVATELRVLDVMVTGTNQLHIGTNVLSLAALTNLLALQRGELDVVAIHGLVEGAVSSQEAPSAVEEIARIGVPLVFVEKEGEYTWREQSGADGTRTVKVGTAQFAALHRLWTGNKTGAAAPSGPVVQTSVDWDAASGSWALSQIELGLFGKRVWLMHEQRDTDAESGSIGIRFRKEW